MNWGSDMRRCCAACVLVCALNARGLSADPVFTDVTASAGLQYVQFDSENPDFKALDEYEMEQTWMSGGAAAGDFDNDGWTDLYVTRLGETDILFRNRGDGTFEDVTAAAGFTEEYASNGAAWGDIDNDGDLDLYVTRIHENGHALYLNNGQGGFSEQGTLRGASLEDAQTKWGYSATFGDYDGDGWLDLHTTEWGERAGGPSYARLLHNKGDATFEDVTLAAGVDMTILPDDPIETTSFTSRFSDLDGDGQVDLVVAADFGHSRVFWNDGDGSFTDGTAAAGVGTDENGMGLTIGDYNADGRLDFFVTSIYDEDHPPGVGNWGDTGNRLFENQGNRTFADVTVAAGVQDGAWGWGTTFLDFDNDGDLDLTMTNGVDFPRVAFDTEWHDDAVRFWRNDNGVFTEIAQDVGIFDTGSGKGLLSFDYDNDGDLDLLIVNNSGEPVLYRNDGGNANDWLRIQTVGEVSNRNGYGAWITVTPELGGDSFVWEVNGGSNFLAQNESIAHFGLGNGDDPVAHVHIVWPSGIEQDFFNVPRNSLLVVEESLALTPIPEPTGAMLALIASAMLLGAAFRSGRQLRGRI